MTLDATQQARLDAIGTAGFVRDDDVPWLVALVTDLAAQVDTLTAEVEQFEDWSNDLAELMPPEFDGDEAQEALIERWVRYMRSENATLRAQVQAVRELRNRMHASTSEATGVSPEHWRGRDYAEGFDAATEMAVDDLDRALDAASPTPHTPTKEHQ